MGQVWGRGFEFSVSEGVVKASGITQIVRSSTVLLCVLALLEKGKSATGATSLNQAQH